MEKYKLKELKIVYKMIFYNIASLEEYHIFTWIFLNYQIKKNKLLLLSDKGQERVLEVGKTNLNDCLTWTTTFGSKHKFIIWNQL